MKFCSQIQVCRDIASFRKIRTQVTAHQSIGFVPTMGGIHEGHLSLIRQARKENELVIASIFVNPLQFSNGDESAYPQTLASDICQLQEECDVVFAPSNEMMYPRAPNGEKIPDFEIDVLDHFETSPEGRNRPGHFRGVATILVKLFNLVQPDHVYFGQKDAMQCILVQLLLRQFFYNIQCHVMETIREPDGLAMSTRNQFLSPSERRATAIIYQGLMHIKDYVLSASKNAESEILVKNMQSVLGQIYAREPLITEIEYISIASADTMTEFQTIVPKGVGVTVSVAVYVGSRRMIDNIQI